MTNVVAPTIANLMSSWCCSASGRINRGRRAIVASVKDTTRQSTETGGAAPDLEPMLWYTRWSRQLPPRDCDENHVPGHDTMCPCQSHLRAGDVPSAHQHLWSR